MTHVKLSVPGMSCGHCTASIESGLRGAAGVSAAVADLASKRVAVTFDPAQTGVTQLSRIIEDLGFDVAGTERP